MWIFFCLFPNLFPPPPFCSTLFSLSIASAGWSHFNLPSGRVHISMYNIARVFFLEKCRHTIMCCVLYLHAKNQTNILSVLSFRWAVCFTHFVVKFLFNEQTARDDKRERNRNIALEFIEQRKRLNAQQCNRQQARNK